MLAASGTVGAQAGSHAKPIATCVTRFMAMPLPLFLVRDIYHHRAGFETKPAAVSST